MGEKDHCLAAAGTTSGELSDGGRQSAYSYVVNFERSLSLAGRCEFGLGDDRWVGLSSSLVENQFSVESSRQQSLPNADQFRQRAEGAISILQHWKFLYGGARFSLIRDATRQVTSSSEASETHSIASTEIHAAINWESIKGAYSYQLPVNLRGQLTNFIQGGTHTLRVWKNFSESWNYSFFLVHIKNSAVQEFRKDTLELGNGVSLAFEKYLFSTGLAFRSHSYADPIDVTSQNTAQIGTYLGVETKIEDAWSLAVEGKYQLGESVEASNPQKYVAITHALWKLNAALSYSW